MGKDLPSLARDCGKCLPRNFGTYLLSDLIAELTLDLCPELLWGLIGNIYLLL